MGVNQLTNKVCAFYEVRIKKLFRDEKGAQAIEYIALGLLGLAIVGAIAGYLNGSGKNTLGRKFVSVMTKLMDQVVK